MTNFTPSQLRAIEYRNLDVCVVAGPGSGKTTVLVERFRHLVEDRGFDLRHILAITFTEKAAANMKAKLAALTAVTATRCPTRAIRARCACSQSTANSPA